MSDTVENHYVSGNFAPVRDEIVAFDLPVTGSLPVELNGRYLRNGPNPIGPVDLRTHHWFVGTGMVHGVRLRDGRAEWYRNRYVRGDEVAAAQGLPPLPGPRHPMFGGAAPNTNVIGHAGATWAIVEAGGLPVELDDELESIRYLDFDGAWPGAFSAHPKRDPVTGELHLLGYYWEWEHVKYVVVRPDGSIRKVVEVPVPGRIMLHDVGITDSSIIILDLPVTFQLEALSAGYPFPYQWDPDYQPRVGVLPREGTADDVRWAEVEPCYVFHPLNAYDLPDGRIVMDVSRHPKMFATDLNGPDEGEPTLDRWTIDPTAGKVLEERLDDRGQEFPRVDERLVGKPHRYGYCATFESHPVSHGVLLQHDVERGTTVTHDYGAGRASGEGVFIPRTDDAAEDDGWVMSLVYDATTDRTDLVVLDAQDFGGEPVATVHLPSRVPYGFHGNWVPDA
jgi:carotenoid cleavage dioxygenase-like enzyme